MLHRRTIPSGGCHPERFKTSGKLHPNLDAFRLVEHGEAVNIAAASDGQFRGTTGQRHNIIVQGNPVRDYNIPWVSRF